MKKNPASASRLVLKKGEEGFSARPAPRHFYKYTYVDDRPGEDGSYPYLKHSSSIFKHNELYFRSVSSFNDPFDCTFQVDSSCSGAERRSYHQHLLEKYGTSHDVHNLQETLDAAEKNLGPGMTKFFDKMAQNQTIREVEQWGLYCLSAVPDNILMWAHYANAHRGFCLQFLNKQGQPFYVEPKPEMRDQTLKNIVPLRVEYSDKFPVVNFIRNDLMTVGINTCLTKAEQWEYEREWRMVDINGPGPHKFPPQCLTGVIFGCRMPEEHQEMIRGWCKDRQPAIKYYEAQQSEDSYLLNIVEIS